MSVAVDGAGRNGDDGFPVMGRGEVVGRWRVVDLRVRLGRLELKNPVLVASGTFGYVREMAPFVRLERLGGVIPKTVTLRPRAGSTVALNDALHANA